MMLLMLSPWSGPAADPPAAEAEVLVLASYHPANEWTEEVLRGLLAGFRADRPNMEPAVEFMDALRFPGAGNEARVLRFLEDKYGTGRFDLIVTLDDEALRFAEQNREWTANAPIVFGGVNNRSIDELSELENATGILERLDVVGTIALGRRLLPDLRTLHVLHDTSDDLVALERLVPAAFDNGPTLVPLTGLTNAELMNRVATFEPGSAILILDYQADAAGVVIPPNGGFQRELVRRASVPVLFLYDGEPGFGLAGRVQSAWQHGHEVAQLGLRVLSGEPASEIPIAAETGHEAVVDYEQMRRFGVPRSRLPDDVLLLSPPAPFAERYRLVGYVLLGFIPGMLAVIAVLARQSRRRSLLLEAASDGILLFHVDGRLIEVNSAGRKLFDLSPAEVSRTRITDLFVGSVANKPPPDLEALAEGQIRHYTLRLRRGNDREFIGSVNTTRLPGDQVQAIVRDVTEQQRANEELKASQELLQTVMDLVPHNIFAKDHEGRFIFVNKMFADHHRLSPADMIGRTTAELSPDSAQAARFHEDDMRVIRSGETVRISAERFTNAHGNSSVYQTVKLPLRLKGRENLALLGVSADITEIQEARDTVKLLNDELEERVRSRTQELEAANRELQTFSYTVSHDLRAPLRVVDGFSQLLLDDFGTAINEEGRDYLDKIRQETRRMGELIDDILKLARISRAEVETTSVDLTRIASGIVENLRSMEPARRLDARLAPTPPVQGDLRLLRIVMTNLLENAWKYTARREHAEIEFGFREDGENSEYFVRDNGAGFDLKYAEKLFEPFQRMHSSREFTGHGIGLATVKRILERHDGAIRAETAPGVGTTFFFRIGRAMTPQSVPPEPPTNRSTQ